MLKLGKENRIFVCRSGCHDRLHFERIKENNHVYE